MCVSETAKNLSPLFVQPHELYPLSDESSERRMHSDDTPYFSERDERDREREREVGFLGWTKVN